MTTALRLVVMVLLAVGVAFSVYVIVDRWNEGESIDECLRVGGVPVENHAGEFIRCWTGDR